MSEDKEDTMHGPMTKEGQREIAERSAASVLEFRRKNAYYYRLLKDMLKHIIPEEKRVLDIGCGPGDLLHALRPSYGVGIDISTTMLRMASEAFPHLNFIVADAEESLPLEGRFDYILISNTVGFFVDVQAAFRQLRRLAKPDTRVVITHYNYLWEPLLKFAEMLGQKMKEPALNWLSVHDLENLMRLEGYEMVRRREGVLLPRRVPLVSDLCNRILAHAPLFRRLSLVDLVVFRTMPKTADEKHLSCSVVIPARNERGNIERIVKEIPSLGSGTEIIFVEGHSVDGTYEEIKRVIAENAGKKIVLLTQEGEGKADAVRKGLDRASGDVLIIFDADLTVNPRDLRKFYNAVAEETGELVIGNRLVYQLQDQAMRFLNLLGNKFFSMAFSYLLDQRIKDTLCGTKAFRKESYLRMIEHREYFGDFDPFGDFDLLFGAAKSNMKIVEVPVRYEARRYGESQIHRFRHGLLLLKMVWRGLWKLKFT